MKTTLVIFGITGDLGRRKLLPALQQVFAAKKFTQLSVLGVSRREVSSESVLAQSHTEATFADKLSMFQMDLAEVSEYVRLKKHLHHEGAEQILIYLSVPPATATRIVDFLGEAGLNTSNVKLLFEKPFGFDEISARDMITRTERYFHEDQIYRIDHYLAKEMAQNIAILRSANPLFETIWNAEHIESIELLAAEAIGIEGRGQFYEQVGALRDVLQGHLLQLLALTLMQVEAPIDWRELPQRRLMALDQIEPADPARSVRAQYIGYQEEADNPGSEVETFVSMELFSRDPRWQDVPIRLTTGKALDRKTTQICLSIRADDGEAPNKIVLHIQPDEGVEIDLFVKKPGYERALERQRLRFSYPVDTALADAYEQVLVDAIDGKKSLFASSDEVMRAWQIVAPVQDAWNNNQTHLYFYEKGSSPQQIIEGK